jgi:hypothetical protein
MFVILFLINRDGQLRIHRPIAKIASFHRWTMWIGPGGRHRQHFSQQTRMDL